MNNLAFILKVVFESAVAVFRGLTFKRIFFFVKDDIFDTYYIR